MIAELSIRTVISDGQTQIIIWLKSWLTHVIMLQQDLIWKHVIWYGFDLISDLNK